MLEEAYTKAATKVTHVYEQNTCFFDGRASISDDPRCRHPSSLINDEDTKPMHNVVQSGKEKNIQEILMEVEI
jgi:hypothetical protein